MAENEAVRSASDAHHRAKAARYLADTQKILKQLQTERLSDKRRRASERSVLTEIKAILREA